MTTSDWEEIVSAVRPDDPFVSELLRGARRELVQDTGRRLRTFDAMAAADPADRLLAVQALYKHLLGMDPPLAHDARGIDSRNHRPVIRTPTEVRESNQATCRDVVLVLASALLKIGMRPLYIQMEAGDNDHALLGLWLRDPPGTLDPVGRMDALLPQSEVRAVLRQPTAGVATLTDRLGETALAVIDCSGSLSGYPSPDSGLTFPAACEDGRRLLADTKRDVRFVLDLQAATADVPFAVRDLKPNLVGREEDLDTLRAFATRSNVLISGQFGVGKSKLAVLYAWQNKRHYQGGVFLLNAADPEGFVRQMASFAASMGAVQPKGANTESSDEALAYVWLQSVQTSVKANRNVLIIVDDAREPAVLTRPLLPGWDDRLTLLGLGARLVVTSRANDTRYTQFDPPFEPMPLTVLDPDPARELLTDGLRRDPRHAGTADRICQLLGHLPLLLRIVNQRLRDPAVSIERYEELLSSSVLGELAGDEIPQEKTLGEHAAAADERRLLSSVMADVWAQMLAHGQGVENVLKVLSMLQVGATVPVEVVAWLVTLPATEDPASMDPLRGAIARLVEQNLLEGMRTDEGDLIPIEVKVHPAIHEYARGKAEKNPRFKAGVIERANERLRNPDAFRDRPTEDLVRLGENLAFLEPLLVDSPELDRLVRVFRAQIDALRAGCDALQQLALQAVRLDDRRLADVFARARGADPRPWFRLAWSGVHERAHKREHIAHADAVTGCAVAPRTLSPGARRFALTVSDDRTGIIWEFDAKGRLRKHGQLAGGNTIGLTGCAIAPDGLTAMTSSRDGTLQSWDLVNGTRRAALAGHAQPINDCAIGADGRFAISVSDDRRVHVWDFAKLAFCYPLLGHTDSVTRCGIADDGRTAVSASRDGTVRVWKLDDSRGDSRVLKSDGHAITACAISADARWVLAASRGGLWLWDLQARGGEEKPRRLEGHAGLVTACAFTADCKLAVTVARDKRLRVWKLESRSAKTTLDPYFHWLTACAVDADGNVLFASDDGSVHRWRLGSPKEEVGHVHGRPNWVNVFHLGSVAISASTDETIWVWDVVRGERVEEHPGHANWVNALAVSGDGGHILSGSLGEGRTRGRDLSYWAVADRAEIRLLRGHKGQVNTCAISRNGEWAVSGAEDRSVYLWHLPDGLARGPFAGHDAPVTTCAIATDGSFAITGADNGRLIRWDFAREDGRSTPCDGHEARVTGFAVSPGDPRLGLSSSWDGTLRLWNTVEGIAKKVFRGHTDGVTACALAGTDTAFSASLDRTIRMWDTASGVERCRIDVGERLRGLVVDATGHRILCGSMSGSVFMFERVTGPGVR